MTSRHFPFPAAALREKLREGYTFSDFRADLMSGVIVSVVAIPLGMALAIASGVAPQYGLYTVMIGGGVVALLGGSRFQVTGPTAAFVVILAPIAMKFGLGGLLTAGLMAGFMILAMGLARMGSMIQYIPFPVTTGFTTGIATVIGVLQLKDFFGLRPGEMPSHFLGKVEALVRAAPTASAVEFILGSFTLAVLLFWPKVNKKIPSPLIALTSASVLAAVIQHLFPSVQIATIGTQFHGIPQAPPHLAFPWSFGGPGGEPFHADFDTIQALIPAAFTITLLGAIESLLSAVVADGMAQTKHDPDVELLSLGIGNILCPFFGGIAATGAIARTATNIRFGARSPLSAVIHALFAFGAILIFAPLVSYLPMASLAALLMLVAYNMAEIRHFTHILKVAPRSDKAVLLTCYLLTVIFDMVLGVGIGIVLASLLFMRRMAEVSTSQLLKGEEHPHYGKKLPHEMVLYEIAGPLFFGAAERAVEALSDITDDIRAVVFDLEGVPAMDVTGLASLESAVRRLKARHCRIYFTGVREQPALLLRKSESISHADVCICGSVDDAVSRFLSA